MYMRQNPKYKIILAALLISLCNSCKDTGPVNYQNSVITLKPQNLSLSTKEVSFHTPQASTSTFQVNCTNIEWEITGIPDWMTVNPTSGYDNTTVTVNVTENTLTSNRLGILSFRSADDSWTYSSPLTISQFRAKYYALPDTDRIEFEGAASTATIKITSNIDDWSVKTNTSMNWCTASKGDGCINLSVTPNSGGTSRTGIIEISTIDGNEYVHILQRPVKISSTTDRIFFDQDGDIRTIEIDTEVPWVITTSCTWIDVSPTSGPAGKSTISVSAMPNNSLNTRSDYFYINLSDDNKTEIPVTQEGFKLIITNTDIECLAPETVDFLTIESNTSWTVQYCPSWVQLSDYSGVGSKTVKVTVAKNTDIPSRYDNIIISLDSIYHPFYIDVWQEGIISSDNGSLHFSQSGYMYLTIYTEYHWTAVASASWIVLSTESGNGDTQLKVSVTENNADTIRTGFILITAENKQIKVLVEQEGKYFYIKTSVLDFSSRGGSSQVTLRTNDSWTATASDEWISLLPPQGTGTYEFTIATSDNPSVKSRSGYVDIVPDNLNQNSNPVRLIVNQAARYLEVTPASVYLSGNSDNSIPITISTDGEVQITTQESWLSINNLSNEKFIIAAQANESSMRTGTVTIYLTDLTDGILYKSINVTQDNKNHDYVDLGLSVKWATCNVGADKPEGYGNYYGWGEVETKSKYTWTENKYSLGENPVILSKYNTSSSRGDVDNKTTLEPIDDVAHVKWGGNWRIPTYDEFMELENECTWIWTTQNGVNGYKITSNKPGYTNKSIFLPAAGMYYDTSNNSTGYYGAYWTSSLDTSNPTSAWDLTFEESYHNIAPNYGRDCGRNVRPVCP